MYSGWLNTDRIISWVVTLPRFNDDFPPFGQHVLLFRFSISSRKAETYNDITFMFDAGWWRDNQPALEQIEAD